MRKLINKKDQNIICDICERPFKAHHSANSNQYIGDAVCPGDFGKAHNFANIEIGINVGDAKAFLKAKQKEKSPKKLPKTKLKKENFAEPFAAALSIARWNTDDVLPVTPIHIEMVNLDTGKRVCRVEMTLENFAMALIGRSSVPAFGKRWSK